METQTEIIVPKSSQQAVRPALWAGVHVLNAPSTRRKAHRLFVLDLPSALATEFLSTEWDRSSNVAILVSDDSTSVSTVLAALRRHLDAEPFVTDSSSVLRRVILANARGASDKLIASVDVVGDKLLVWSCEPKLYECPVAAIPQLATLPSAALKKCELSESGSRIRWPQADFDLDLDTIRYHADHAFRRKMDREARRRTKTYAKAIRALRVQRGIAQGEIPNLTDREVRRLENGEVQPHASTLQKLAQAHGMSLQEYLAALAETTTAKSARSK